MNVEKITIDALLGQAVGDAFGVPVEFMYRKEVRSLNLRDMVGKEDKLPFFSKWGHMIPRGVWSDDTSMAVASMASIISHHGQIDWEDHLRQFNSWWTESKYCCQYAPFGLGGNTSVALHWYRMGRPALECGGKGLMDNGNGALMRILPFSLHCIFRGMDTEETVQVISNGSAITHGHDISKMSCFAWTEFLRSLAEGKSPDEAVAYVESLPYGRWFSEEALGALDVIMRRETRALTENDIGQTGYVVDTLYSAFYSLIHADSYETSILNAVNLGYDTDTAGAVTGMAAGILYRQDGIPERWMDRLQKREELERYARDFAACYIDT